MKIQISNDLPLARKFNRTFRYIDDLLTFNNPGFCTFIDQIYPKELKLKRTTEGSDLKISIEAGRYTTDLYDKRQTFKFKIVNFPATQCIAHSIHLLHLCTCFNMCCIFAGDSMLVMRSHGVSTAVKRDAADDI